MKAILQWVLRTMMKDQTGVMRTLPRKDLVNFNVQMTAERLMRNGIDPNSLKNANQVENALKMIDDRPKVQEGIKSTESAKVFNIKGEELDPNKPIVGGTQSGKKIDTDAFIRDAEIKTRLEKQNKESVAKIRQRMVNEAIDNVSPGLSGDRKVDAELVAEDLAERMGKVYDDMPIKERLKLYEEAYTGLSKQRFKNMKKPKDADDQESSYDDGPADFDPDADNETFATGGRAGFANGTGAPSIKYDFDRKQGPMGPEFETNKVEDAIREIIRRRIPVDFANIPVTDRAGIMLGFDDIGIAGEKDLLGGELKFGAGKNFGTGEKQFDIAFKKKFNQGGRAGFFLGSGSKFPKGLATLREIINAVTRKSDVIKNPSDILKLSNPKAFNKMLEDAKGKALPKEGIMATDKVKDYQTEMAKDRVKTVRDLLKSGKNLKALDNTRAKLIDMYMKEIMRKGNFNKEQAKGIATQLVDIEVGKSSGAKLTDEGILQLENILKNMETGGKKKRDLNADGGRIGFKDGMTRRTFLKILGGAMAIPIIGKFLKPLKTVKGVTKVPIIKTDNVPGKPEWFDQLVNKVIIEGDDVTKRFATGERQSIHQKTLDDGSVVRVTEDIDDGAVRVEYESKTNPYEETTQLEYKKPKPDEGDPSPTAEFSAAETGPVAKSDSPRLDFEKDIEEFATGNVDELVTDFSKLKEYATGKKPTMKEIVEAKKKKDQAKKLTEGDFDTEYELMEKRQGQPFYDPSLPDDFASGGIARMLGE
jgi:hypothetical protein